MRHSFLLFFLLFSFSAFSQKASVGLISDMRAPFLNYARFDTPQKRCAIDEISQHEFEHNARFRQDYLEAMQKWEDYKRGALKMPAMDTGVYYIPVVFHIVHNPGTPIGTAENISMSKIESQVRIMNEDFRKIAGTNGDGNGVDTKLEFFLAQRDPQGNCTDGVLRYADAANTNTSFPATAMKAAAPNWDPDRYFNIWVVNSMAGGVIGFGTWPWAKAASPQLDGITLVHDVVGDEAPVLPNYNLGRTASHEAGHNFGLFHTFQGGCAGLNDNTCFSNATSSGNSGDGVCDTPPAASPNQPGCPTVNSCNESTTATGGNVNDQVENYMDYTDDPCMNMFTQGQKDRMMFFFSQYRSTLLDSMNAVNAGYYGCLGVSYCPSNSIDSSNTQIHRVQFQSVDVNSNSVCRKYTDYTDQFADVIRDSTFSLTVNTGVCSGGSAGSNKITAYTDWNRDGDFADPNETWIVKPYGPGIGSYSVNITAADTSVLGRIGMRIVCSEDPAAGPCGTYNFGETEDYAIDIRNNPPTVLDHFPKSGQDGTPVTIIGTRFEGATDVLFNGVSSSIYGFTVISDDTIRTFAPNSTTGPITVVTSTGSDTGDSIFTYTVLGPVIVNLTPSTGLIGASINIQGQRFSGFTRVEFNGVPAVNPTLISGIIQATVPAGATTGKVTVVHPNGNAISPMDFTVLQPLPTATIGASPGSICQGETTLLTFTMTGTGPYNVYYNDGSNNYSIILGSSGDTRSFTLSSTTTFTVDSVIDAFHVNSNPQSSKTVNVNTVPIADFSYSTNGLQANFTNQSSGALFYEWNFGDGATSNGFNPQHTYAAPGDYYVTLVSESNAACRDTIGDTLSIVTGISAGLQEGDIKVYPNPANELIQIETDLNIKGEVMVQIVGMDGRRIKSHSFDVNGYTEKETIIVNDLASGTYLLRFMLPNGSEWHQKIQKK